MLAQGIAQNLHLDPTLVAAIIEQESAWDTWAIRYEPAFQKRYVEPLGLTNPSEIAARSISWGLMQLMGQSARELGYNGRIAALCDPSIGVEWGCRHFQGMLGRTGGDVRVALLHWNGGGRPAYVDEVLARKVRYT